MIFAAPNLLPYGSQGDGPAFAVPHGVVLFIAVLCFIVFLAEGAVLDWSAVFLTSVHRADPAYAGLGYAAFATTMTIGRLAGDMIVRRAGSTNIIIYGGLCAAAGFAIATFGSAWEAGLVGYALVGAGCANIAPILYTAVGRQTLMPEHLAVPAISTIGYAGILAGPAVIGFVAHGSSLSTAFLMVAALLVGVAGSGRFLRV
jgi:predicted MFS family arabinose efflux permease